MPPRERTPDRVGVTRGIAAGSVALAVVQIGSRLVDRATPPIQALGDLVVRVTPSGGSRSTVDAVGNHDKALLRVAVLLVATLLASVVGVQHAQGHHRRAWVGIALLGLVPVLAVATAPTGSTVRELLILLPGAIAGGAALQLLGRPELAARDVTQAQARVGDDRILVRRGLARRQVLRAAAIAIVAGAAGEATFRVLRRPPASLTRRLRQALPAVTRPVPPVVDELPGASSLITRHLYRVDTALETPFVDPDTWRLPITRGGEQIGSLTYDQLRALATTEADITIGCVDNIVGGDLVGSARWQGVLLRDLLPESTGRIRAVSVDGFVASFPARCAFDGRPAMIALGMNGRTLPIRHGFPARLVVPGLYGFTSAVKWLAAIDVSDREDLPGFWADRGWTPGAQVAITSRIDTPSSGDRVSGPLRVAGMAWAPISGVGAVEVQVDDGPWQRARLSAHRNGSLWRQFALDATAGPGVHVLRVRATDRRGTVQESLTRGTFPDGATGLHQVTVRVA